VSADHDPHRGVRALSGRRLIVEADGGSRGNPGPAGYGALVRDAETGELLAERAAGIGISTNNVAEYGGLIAGLTAALEHAPSAVDVRMDSKLVVEQMSGRWKVKHPAMKPLAAHAGALVARLGRVRFSWIPRAENGHADRLANEAMDAQRDGVRWRPGGDIGPADDADAWLAEREPTASPVVAPGSAAPAPGSGSAAAESAPAWRPPTSTPLTTLLLRHGQTALSVDKRFSGVGDPSLTDIGVAQASAAATRLADSRAVAVISSPLRRARSTAALVADALRLDVVVDERLRETDFGVWEGHTFAEVTAQWPDELAAWLADPGVAPPGGESFVDTTVRVRAALDRLRQEFDGRRIVVVSHVTPIKTLLRLALDAPPSALHRIHLDLACLSQVQWFADGPAVVRSMNDTAHLA